MKILITGATGLVGQEIVAECHRAKIDVHYLTTSKNKIVSEPNYKGFFWNPENTEIDGSCFLGVDAIINLAGASISKRWTASYKKEILNSRLDSLKTLHKGLSSIDSSKIKSLVSASAIGIYPSSFQKEYFEQDSFQKKGFLAEVVDAWENEIDTFKSFNLNLVKIRIGLVLSDAGGALPEMAKPINFFVGSAFGNGKQWQSWIHVNDLARIFIFGVTNNLQGIYNGVAANPVTNTQLISEIAKAIDKPILLPKVPSFMLKLILGEMSSLLLESQKVSNQKISQTGFEFNYQTITTALNALYKK